MKTLLSLWIPHLPFGIYFNTASNVTVPHPTSLRRYKTNLSIFSLPVFNNSSPVLGVAISTKPQWPPKPTTLVEKMMPLSVDIKDAVRSSPNQFHLITTFWWDFKTDELILLLSDVDYQKLLVLNALVVVFRSDSWKSCSTPIPLKMFSAS